MADGLTRVEIDRRVWAHEGQRTRRPALMLDWAGQGARRRQCCLGCIMTQMGIPDGHLEGMASPTGVAEKFYPDTKLAPELEVLAHRGVNAEVLWEGHPTERMMAANDLPVRELVERVENTEYGKRVLAKLSEKAKPKRVREALIRDAGREAGLRIVFVN